MASSRAARQRPHRNGGRVGARVGGHDGGQEMAAGDNSTNFMELRGRGSVDSADGEGGVS